MVQFDVILQFSTAQLAEQTAATKQMEALSRLVGIKVKEVIDSVQKFVDGLNVSGVSAAVISRDDSGLDKLIALVRKRTPVSGFDAVLIIEIKVMSPGQRWVHLGVSIDINVIRARSVANPFYFAIRQLMKYEKFIYLDENGDLYDTSDYKLRLPVDIDIVDLVRMWFENPRNWF